MKRMWIGIALLLVLLAAGLLVAWQMHRIHAPVIRDLEQAEQYALADNWQKAALHALRARKTWQSNWYFSASVADHSPMEEIDSLFGELLVFLQTRDGEHFAATCARLSKLTQAMEDAHAVSWWNLL